MSLQLKKHLPGLDGLRALAAMTVVIFHTDQNIVFFSDLMKSRLNFLGTQNYAVTLFFVLSGFLISHLLLKEKKQTEFINFKSFYLRRILKIWPLYYLIITITVILYFFTKNHFWINNIHNCWFYIFLIGNMAYAMGKTVLPIGIFWSIGVEEQFYLFWPFIIKSRNAIKSIVLFLICFVFLKLIFRFCFSTTPYFIIMETRFSCMAIGAIGAWIYFINHNLLKIIFKPFVQVFAWLALASLYVKPLHIGWIFNDEFYSVIFLIIILNSACNRKSILLIDNKLFNFIGKRSYGIYCWHPLVILSSSYIIKKLHFLNNVYSEISIIILVLLLTILISILSYSYYEKKFLDLKQKLS